MVMWSFPLYDFLEAVKIWKYILKDTYVYISESEKTSLFVDFFY